MIVSGYCDKQNKEYVVEFKKIGASAMEDTVNRTIAGKLSCEYSKIHDCCLKPSDCSILKSKNMA